MSTKKKRGCNYTSGEKEILLHLIKKNQHLIESKETNGHMNLKKREAWELVCQQYNAVAETGFRKWEQLRHLYENIKQRSKKNNTIINDENYEFSKEIQQKTSNDKQDFYSACGGPYKSFVTEKGPQNTVKVVLETEPLCNPYEAELCFDDVKGNKNNENVEPELIIINTDEIDDQETLKATEHQECKESQTSASEIRDEITGHNKTKCNCREIVNNMKLQLFREKLRNEKLKNKYLINKNRMDISKYKIKMEILKMKLNKKKCNRNRKH